MEPEDRSLLPSGSRSHDACLWHFPPFQPQEASRPLGSHRRGAQNLRGAVTGQAPPVGSLRLGLLRAQGPVPVSRFYGQLAIERLFRPLVTEHVGPSLAVVTGVSQPHEITLSPRGLLLDAKGPKGRSL